ncbi:SAM hydrolase/SAM-dependent halogenase family protein [Bacillus andreraoultii]|uniref:SAM hydrolase/SAM-dependent halogenase family protein n=1 Tax=Bacillus andreraoultii TaxID=1499685 RepID=UPI00053B8F25|nr:S-adenosyl-l-methionine hydroxide adenosyltransferase family protein [Bacillus andreraoultii]
MSECLVIQTDFGVSDGAVAAMYGVAISVSKDLRIFDLTHDIPQYNIWDASYRLFQTISYWPENTVFISVVDPGVGSERKSIVVKTKSNHYIVTPDNGTVTHIQKFIGIDEVREIDETVNRLPNSGHSYTFHGRDVYAYTGARLASGKIHFQDVGPVLNPTDLVQLPLTEAVFEQGIISGTIDVLDIRFGNLWTNISRELFLQLDVKYGNTFEVTIENSTRQVYKNIMTFGRSFADSHLGEPLLFVNSLDNIGVAINQGSFANAYHVESGLNWKIHIRKVVDISYN